MGERMTNCRICSGDLRPYVRKHGYLVLKCTRCGFGQVDVTAEEIAAFYDKAYFQGEKAHFAQGENSETPATHSYWIEQNLKRLPKTEGLRVLEIGPGVGGPIAGCIARVHPEIEFAVVEISRYACDVLAARGFRVFEGRVTDSETIAACRTKYDLIFGTEVIEHDPDPHAFVGAVHAMLKPGGWAAFTTGNLDGWIARWKREDWYYLDPPAHVSYYSRRSTHSIFKAEGFDNISVRCYGFNYINLKLKTHLPGILTLTHLSRISTGMSIAAQRTES